MQVATFPSVSFWPDSDIVYVRLSDERAIRTEIVDDFRLIDYSEDGQIVGVEFLEASRGVSLEGLPGPESLRDAIAEALAAHPAPSR